MPEEVKPQLSEMDILNAPDDKGSGDDVVELDETESSDDDVESDDDVDLDEPTEDEDEEEPSDDDSEDSEESAEEEPEEDQSDVSLYQRVKKANPDLFKKYPELKDAIFRDQKFSEVFTTPEEARNAAEAISIYGELESDIVSGKPSRLFESLQKTNKEAFADFAHAILPALQEQNKELYGEVLAGPFKLALKSALMQGKRHGNKNLEYAAQHLSDFFFGDTDFENIPSRAKKEPSEDEKRLAARETEYESRRLRTFHNETNEITIHRLEKEVSKAIEKLELNPYTRKKMVGDMIQEIDRMVAKDARHLAGNRSLYEQARSADYSSEWKSRIAAAYLARARAVINIARKKVLDEAELKPKGNREGKIPKRLAPGNTSSNRPEIRSRDIDYRKTSEKDILEGRVTLKGGKK